jgi:hypothetical protein
LLGIASSVVLCLLSHVVGVIVGELVHRCMWGCARCICWPCFKNKEPRKPRKVWVVPQDAVPGHRAASDSDVDDSGNGAE